MEPSELPRVDVLAAALAGWSELPRALLTAIARRSIDEARDKALRGETADPEAIAAGIVDGLAADRFRPIINASGVLLHTNLGRAPLAVEAADRARGAAVAYGNVEIDGAGRRSRRGRFASALLTTLTGAESALVVNNNAGALLLALAALAGPGGRVAVSRGELIEIGGSFRLPELMEAGGTRLVEVGTTNRTRLADYERVAGHVDAILKVHPSNYRVEGFVEDAGWEELAGLARSAALPFIADVGSGLLDSAVPWLPAPPDWLRSEPAIRQTAAAGATVTLASGDKLLGGPQAGIAVGSASALARMASHPLARALRVDGPTLAALETTLEMYATGRGADIPFWRMAVRTTGELEGRARRLVSAAGCGSVVAGESLPGAGSAPGAGIPSPVVQVADDVEARWERLIAAGVLASRRDGALQIDLRCVDLEDDPVIVAALRV
jgi:L-seryl-tRNA(Ser) seleniumtransferase